MADVEQKGAVPEGAEDWKVPEVPASVTDGTLSRQQEAASGDPLKEEAIQRQAEVKEAVATGDVTAFIDRIDQNPLVKATPASDEAINTSADGTMKGMPGESVDHRMNEEIKAQDAAEAIDRQNDRNKKKRFFGLF